MSIMCVSITGLDNVKLLYNIKYIGNKAALLDFRARYHRTMYRGKRKQEYKS